MSRGALLLKPLETAPGLHPLGGDQETKQHGRQEDEKSHTPNLNIFFWQKKQWTRIIYLFSMKMDSGWFPKKKRGKYEKKLTEKLQFFKKNVILGSISSPKGSRHHRRRQSSNSKDHHLKQLAEPKTSANGFIHSSINLSVSLGSQSSQMNSYYS